MNAKNLVLVVAIAMLAACNTGGLNRSDGTYAPGVAGEMDIDGLLVGHRLMAAGEYELALKAYIRGAAQHGINVDTLSAMGSANLKLGRLWQAEKLLRQAVDEDPEFPPAWNNLGVTLVEMGNYPEAVEAFRRAFAADNGNSDQIRDNLRLALAKVEDPAYAAPNENGTFQLVRRGPGDYLILTTP